MNTIHKTLLVALASAASGFAAAPAVSQGYLNTTTGQGAAKAAFDRCWRTSDWTPAMATMECDPDLVPKPAPRVVAAPPPPPPPPVAKPKPPPPPVVVKAKPCDSTFTMGTGEYFAFGQARLEDKTVRPKLLGELRAKLAACASVDSVVIEGYTDRIGSEQANMKLSEARAETAKDVMVKELGVPANKIVTRHMGEAQQIADCPDAQYKTRKALIDCLAPNRRVVINIRGTGK
ncbi:MAG: OmpA family protein [Methylocella sp.]